MIRVWRPIPPTCRRLHAPQAVCDPPMGLEFLHHTKRYRPGRSPFLSRIGRKGRGIARFVIWGWDPILHGCDGTSMALLRSKRSRMSQRPLEWIRATNQVPELQLKDVGEQLGWLDGCQNCLRLRPRL